MEELLGSELISGVVKVVVAGLVLSLVTWHSLALLGVRDATKKLTGVLTHLERYFEMRFEQMERYFEDRLHHHEERFDRHEGRMNSLEERERLRLEARVRQGELRRHQEGE